MNTDTGKSLQRSSYSLFPLNLSGNILQVLFLLGLGVLAVVLHVHFRMPMKLPGRHGLEFMVLFMAGRVLSNYRYASSLSSVGASALAFIPVWGFDNPFMPITFLLPGMVIDFFYNIIRTEKYFLKLGLMALAGGIAYATIPVVRFFIMQTTGFPFSSLLLGPEYPVFTHFLFGSAGAAFGYFIFSKIRKH